MDNDSNSSSNSKLCDDWEIVDAVTIVIEGVGGGLGAIICTVALVFVLVSRFYKDIVQRLILYKLITMLVYSLFQYMSFKYDNSKTYRAFAVLLPQTAYYINLGFTFWLTIALYLCIVNLKELKNFKKLEPIAIVTSCLIPLVSAALMIPFTNIDCSDHKLIINFSSSTKDSNNLTHIIGYSIAGILYFIISVLVVIIFIVAVKRSRIYHRRQDAAESLLVTNNKKWKILSKQLLPLVVYPIVNTIMAIVFYPLLVLYFNGKNFPGVYLYSLISFSGLITGTIVIIHLCILKCKKKQRERKRMKINDASQKAYHFYFTSNHDDVFTRETVASTDAHTTYQYTCTSSVTTDDELVSMPIN